MQKFEQEGRAIVDAANLASPYNKNFIRVLHVDDDPAILEISKLILMDMGNFEIDQVCCVDDALKKLSSKQYDVVISDYEMPQKNGLEFLKRLREQKNDVAFIIFTGKGREDVAVKALNLGADRYLDKTGSTETVYGELAHAINNLVEQKKSKEQLDKSEIKYRILVEESFQGILIMRPSPLRLVFSNEASAKILGYSCQEFLSLSSEEIMGLVYHEDRKVFFSRMENRLQGELPASSLEFRAVRKDGSLVWLETLSNPVEYDGQLAVQGIFLNIDERKKSEEKVRKSELRYRELANLLPETVFETDPTGKITFLSELGLEKTGYTSEDFERGLNILQFLTPQDRDRAIENVKKSMAGREIGSIEYTLTRKDGTTFPVLVKVVPIVSENKVIGLRGLSIDISERKKAEEKLKESEEKYQTTFETSMDALMLLDNKGFFDCNKATLGMFGCRSVHEFTKFHPADLSPPTQPDGTSSINAAKSHIQKAFQTGTDHFFWIHKRKDGTTFPADVFLTRMKLKGQEVLQSSVRDITERKNSEEALIAAGEKFRTIFENVHDVITYVDTRGKILDVNDRIETLLGYKREEIIGKNFVNLGLIKFGDAPKLLKLFFGSIRKGEEKK